MAPRGARRSVLLCFAWGSVFSAAMFLRHLLFDLNGAGWTTISGYLPVPVLFSGYTVDEVCAHPLYATQMSKCVSIMNFVDEVRFDLLQMTAAACTTCNARKFQTGCAVAGACARAVFFVGYSSS